MVCLFVAHYRSLISALWQSDAKEAIACIIHIMEKAINKNKNRISHYLSLLFFLHLLTAPFTIFLLENNMKSPESWILALNMVGCGWRWRGGVVIGTAPSTCHEESPSGRKNVINSHNSIKMLRKQKKKCAGILFHISIWIRCRLFVRICSV